VSVERAAQTKIGKLAEENSLLRQENEELKAALVKANEIINRMMSDSQRAATCED
jgi:regulator of replication initiation timing